LLDLKKELLFYGTPAYRAHLPFLPGWFGEVAVPAFETRLTLLYEREGRSFAQAVPAYYPADAQPD
jgi:hypothetical protein